MTTTKKLISIHFRRGRKAAQSLSVEAKSNPRQTAEWYEAERGNTKFHTTRQMMIANARRAGFLREVGDIKNAGVCLRNSRFLAAALDRKVA